MKKQKTLAEKLNEQAGNMELSYSQRRKAKYKVMKEGGLLGIKELNNYFSWRDALPKTMRIGLPSEPSEIKRIHYNLAGQRYAEYTN